MPDTITKVAKRLASFERRLRALERARPETPSQWQPLPLTGPAAIADLERPPEMRVTPWSMLELSGLIALPEQKAEDQAVLALLPLGFRPEVIRTASPLTDSSRKPLYLEVTPEGQIHCRLPWGTAAKTSWISLDGISCRLDRSDEG
jgi:hypothetical protein